MAVSKKIKITATLLAVLLLFWGFLNILPPKKSVQNNPFLVGEGNLPMIAAHRGGGLCNPENTMLAFRAAVNTFHVDIN